MNLGRNAFTIGFFAVCLPVFAMANGIPVLNITNNTNPEIVELYQQYQDIQGKIDQIQSERVDKLGDNYRALKENEQSLANRTLTATTTAATGAGSMELAQGLSEQKTDKEAEQSMSAYIATMRCKYGNGKQVKAGPEEIELPGGNDSEIAKLRNEYFALAADLKERKNALGMKPGIESEEILDKSEMGLYDDENIGINDGAYASLYRVQMLGSEKDEQEIDALKETAKTRVIAGATTAGAGVVAGVVGNATINKNAPKEQSKQINREYDKKLADATAEQKDITTKLENAIAENASAVKRYNEELEQHRALVESMSEKCRFMFADYVEKISKLSPIENETDYVPNNLPDFDEQRENLDNCISPDEDGEQVYDWMYEEDEEEYTDEEVVEQKSETDVTETCCPCTESNLATVSRAARLSRSAAQVVQKSNDACCACTAPQKTSNTAKNNKINYKEACGADYNKKDPSIRCIDNVFTNKTEVFGKNVAIGGTQTDPGSAKKLAQEWVRVQRQGRAIECSNEKPRTIPVMASEDYGIKCASKEADKEGKRGYFEFIFDDLKESWDSTVYHSTSKAICEKIYKQKSAGSAPSGAFHCLASKEICDQINGTMNYVHPGAAAKIVNVSGQNRCVMSWTTDCSKVTNDFKDKLDSFALCKGAQTQLQNDGSLENMLEQYVATKLQINISSVDCSGGSRPYCGSGCGSKGHGDNAKACRVGNKVVEFVLDDIHEYSKKKQSGSKQSMACVVSGGVFDGQGCKFANKKQCDVFIASSAKICPSCKAPKWNPDTNRCELPDAATVTKLEKTEKRAMIVGGVVVTVAVTVASAGTAGAPMLAVVLSGVEVTGGAMEYFAQRKIDGMAHDFFLKSAKCNSEKCAKEMIANNIQQMANIQNDLETYEIEALDHEFARLLDLINPESDFYKKIVEQGATLEDNKKGFFDPEGWNQAQVWRAIGIGLQFASLGEALFTKIAGAPKFASKFPRMSEKLISKVQITRKGVTITKTVNAADNATDVSKATTKADNVADAVTTTSKQKETTRPVLYNIDSKSGSEISEINKINDINNTNGNLTQKPIGVIRELGVNRDELPEIIKNLEKDGYRLEVVDDINDTKMYRIFADNENDIEEAQKRLLETASSQSDKNARLAAVGNYYNPRFEADSFYNSYKESTKELLLNDPDVEKARQNWDNMNEYERWKFEHQTNRKIRRQLINEDASPVAYGRPDSGAGASYAPQRIGSEAEQTAKELDGHDKYNLNSNASFEDVMEHLVHENYHYAQDVGKTETPKWLLDYNLDNYTRDGAGGYGAYHQQPLEAGVKALGRDVKDAFVEKNMTEKLDDLRKTSIELQFSDTPSQIKLGDDMHEFLNNPTSDNYEKFRSTANRLKYEDETQEVIKSFDNIDFWDYTRSMAEKTDAAKQSNSGAQRLTSESNNNFSGFNLGDDVPKKTNEADDFVDFIRPKYVAEETNEADDFVDFGKQKPTEPIKMSDFGSSKSSFNVGETGNTSTSSVRPRPNTATQQGTTKRNTSGFKVGESGRPNNTRAKTVSETTSLDWIQKGEEEGRARIDKFREKYDLSINGRKKYTREQWYEILDNELGYSDAEEAFKKDFKQGMRESYW